MIEVFRRLLPKATFEVSVARVYLVWLTVNVVVWDLWLGSVTTDAAYWAIQLCGASGILYVVVADLLGHSPKRPGPIVAVPFMLYNALAFRFINVDYFISFVFLFMTVPWAFAFRRYEYVALAVLSMVSFFGVLGQLDQSYLAMTPDHLSTMMVTSVVSTGLVSIFMFLTLWTRGREASALNEKLQLLGMQSSFFSHEVRASLQRLEQTGSEEAAALRSSIESFEVLLFRPADVRQRFARFSAASLCGRLQTAFGPFLPEGVTLELEHNGVELHGEHVLIERALRNLVRNGLEAMAVTDCRGKLTVSFRASVDGQSITVSNDGSSISKSQLRRIFDPFFSTKRGVNRGLGLYLVKTIMELHGGRVICRSWAGPVTFEMTWKGGPAVAGP